MYQRFVSTYLAIFVSPLLVSMVPIAAAEKPLKVYLLAGQSNMDGFGGLEALEYQAKHGDPDRRKVFAHLLKGDGWAVRDDVWITFQDRKGPLTAGFGVGKNFFGVEWDFGNVVGDYHDAPVLIIKTSWGGASLRRMFRPPSSGDGAELARAEYETQLKQYETKKEKNKNAKKPSLEKIQKVYGQNYRRMMKVVDDTLADIKSVVPSYQGQGYEVAGFVWFQGFNDQFGGAEKEYHTHLANLIRDVRKKFKKPNLPVVIGQMGHGGTDQERAKRQLKPHKGAIVTIKAAQAKVAAMDEFKGTVALVKTDVHWDWKAQAVFDKGWREHLDEWRKIGAHFPFHYLGSPYTFLKVGHVFGDAMIGLHKKPTK